MEKLLPWLDKELWSEIKKKKDEVRVNTDFDAQVKQMQEGTWNAEPISNSILDRLEASNI